MSFLIALITILPGDMTVSRSVVIESDRPIWVLTLEAAKGLLDGRSSMGTGVLDSTSIRIQSTKLSIDGNEASNASGMVRALWRLGGFVLWDSDGTVERTTCGTVNDHFVRIHDKISNGTIFVEVLIGPPLADKRVKSATLTLSCAEKNRKTTILLSCSADIKIGCVGSRIASKIAGKELSAQVIDLSRMGIEKVRSGRDGIQEVVKRFIAKKAR